MQVGRGAGGMPRWASAKGEGGEGGTIVGEGGSGHAWVCYEGGMCMRERVHMRARVFVRTFLHEAPKGGCGIHI